MDIHEALLNKLLMRTNVKWSWCQRYSRIHRKLQISCFLWGSVSEWSIIFIISFLHKAWILAICTVWIHFTKVEEIVLTYSTCLPPTWWGLVQGYLIVGLNGLLCINVSKLPYEVDCLQPFDIEENRVTTFEALPKPCTLAYNVGPCNKFIEGDCHRELLQWRRGSIQMHRSLWLSNLRMDKNWRHSKSRILLEWVPPNYVHWTYFILHYPCGWWI